MTTAHLCRRRPDDGSVEILAAILVRVTGGPAVIEPVKAEDRPWVEAILEPGALGPGDRRLRPEDGEAFIRALPASYRGSRLWVEILEDSSS